jgi:hypothetical protein
LKSNLTHLVKVPFGSLFVPNFLWNIQYNYQRGPKERRLQGVTLLRSKNNNS